MTALYRHFDADGRLLYVGISRSVAARLAAHSRSRWDDAIARVDVERFETRQQALAAEKYAIRHEGPMHNIQLVPRPATEKKPRRVKPPRPVKPPPVNIVLPEPLTQDTFKAARKVLGLSQEQLGKELGLTRQTINRYERGREPVPRKVDLAMAHLLRDHPTE